MSDRDNGHDPVGLAVSSLLDVDPATLSDEASPETVGTWDSLSHLNLVMGLESEFGISLTPEEALEMKTLGLIRAILREHGIGLPAAGHDQSPKR